MRSLIPKYVLGIVLGLAAGLFLGAVLWAKAAPRQGGVPKADQNLLVKASKVTQVTYVSPNPITGGGWATRYIWLSDNEVLLVDATDYRVLNIVRENVITGKKQVLYTMIKRFNNSFGRLWQVVPSPHFKWLLWSMSGTDTSLLWGAATDGSRHFGPVMNTGANVGHILWLDDSHWIQIDYSLDVVYEGKPFLMKALLFSVDDPEHGSPIKITTPPGNGMKGMLDLDSMRLTPDRHLIAHTLIETSEIAVFKQSLDSGGKALQKSIISLSPGADVYETAFSPQGDRLAWLTAPEKGHVASLWVGRIDGSRIRKLGSLPLSSPLDPYTAANQLQQIKWTPDGKYLSFIYKDALWTVPVDQQAGAKE